MATWGAARTGARRTLVLRALAVVSLVPLASACTADRSSSTVPPVFDTDVAPILLAHCVSCHGSTSPAAGWSATSFLAAIACVEPSGAPAALPPSTAPILTALATAPHQGLLSSGDQQTLAAWIAAGAPAFVGTVHPAGIVDPRSSAFHGTFLRSERWSAMLDAADPNACGRCHAGTPAPVPGVTTFAPNATACTTCHSEGPLACNTCHGSGTRIYPPRDLCFFPGDAPMAGAHAAHVQPSEASTSGIPCSTCHPVPGDDVIGGLHGNGQVEVIFDTTKIGPEASYDSATSGCAVTCHDLGGQAPRPLWSEALAITCNSCHLSPPANHYPGACSGCHIEANATGTALSGGPLHMNGVVDVGNGSGLCGACHGSGASPWPSTAAHPAHQTPSLSAGIACASCHPIPTNITDPTHLDGKVEIAFTGLAVARASSPVWNGTTCSSVACHGANLADPAGVPTWTDTSGDAAKCGACHGIPPLQHTTSMSCNLSGCHGSEVTISAQGVPSISVSGKTLHIDGIIEP